MVAAMDVEFNYQAADGLTVIEAAHFFEGTEKLLEVWFSRQQPEANQGSGDLHTIPGYSYTLDFPESQVISQPDQTLEILMSELDPAVMDQFYMKDGVTAKDVTRESRIRDLIPGSVIEATLFNPCGYSMNGMKSDGTYWTIHVTPEPEFSYVSFETNLSQTSYDDLIRKVVEVFKPGKFVTTLFVNQSSKCRTVLSSPQKTEGFKRLDCQNAMFNDYNFVFTSFAKQQQQQS
ncbi:S-adenosylmethionine decarboxylase proenzyme-like [Nycticebus coucang]|uniref:S-adenosylmethionine decarboxylase proenzyme-like n=1 Tax=Nycticebus coucang TaxID=9470 RepID=UPI00234D1E14|nr:S-adenosylmethionine decarboxylase proenzyme-like [Nycticebus coucang]